MGRIRVGVSGWNYDSWRGPFYPDGLPRRSELAYLGRQMDTIEVNATFYSLSKPTSVRKWCDAVPPDVVLAIKGSRFITHNRKLRDTGSALANFFASGVLELGAQLGPVLWQLPAQLRFDAERIDTFLGSLPKDHRAAAALAQGHDDRVGDPAYGPGDNHRLRHVLEVRDESYLCDELVRIARRHGVALAFSHASEWPYTEELTAGFVYVRLHGPGEVYASGYGEEALRGWAERLRRWRDADEPADAVRITDRSPPQRRSRDVYVYFDNDQHAHAPRDALRLRELLDGALQPLGAWTVRSSDPPGTAALR